MSTPPIYPSNIHSVSRGPSESMSLSTIEKKTDAVKVILGMTQEGSAIIFNLTERLSPIPAHDSSTYLSSDSLVKDIRNLIDNQYTIPYLQLKLIFEKLENFNSMVTVSLFFERGLKLRLLPLARDCKKILIDDGAAYYFLREIGKQNKNEFLGLLKSGRVINETLSSLLYVEKFSDENLSAENFLNFNLINILYKPYLSTKYLQSPDKENLEILQEMLQNENTLESLIKTEKLLVTKTFKLNILKDPSNTIQKIKTILARNRKIIKLSVIPLGVVYKTF